MRNLFQIFGIPFLCFLGLVPSLMAQPGDTDCAFEVEATVNMPACPGGDDGAIELNSSVDGPLNYEWINIGPLPVGTRPDSLGDLSAGEYILQVSNLEGCTDTISVFVEDPMPLNFSIATFPPSCHDSDDGVIHVENTEGATDLEYTINFGITPQDSPDFSGLNRGEYTITVITDAGCTYDRVVQLDAPPPIEIELALSQPPCPGEESGEVEALADGGTGTFMYALNGGNFGNIRRFRNLPPGNYSLRTRDENGCVEAKSFTIESPAVPNIEVQTDSTTCPESSDGRLIIIIEALDFLLQTFEYSLDGINYQSDSIFTGLASGEYEVYVRNQDSCVFVQNAIVNQPEWPDIEIIIENVTCPGAADGTLIIIIEALDALGSYSISFDGTNYIQDTIFGGLSGGIYDIYIQNPSGCILELQIEIDEPEAPTANSETQEVLCPDGMDGWFKLNPIGGRPPFQYSLDGQNFQEESAFTGLAAGIYQVTIMDSAQCYLQKSIEIKEPAAFDLAFSIGQETCDKNNGWIASTINGGTPPYQYQWNTNSEESVLTNLSAAQYILQIIDAHLCPASDTVMLTNAPAPELHYQKIDAAQCFGSSDGAIEVEIFSESHPLQYRWSNGSNESSLQQANAGNYFLTVEDANQCRTIFNLNIEEPEALQFKENISFGFTGGQVQLEASGGIPPYQFEWPDGSQENIQQNLPDGNYSVTLTDANNCKNIQLLKVENPNPPLADQLRIYPNPTDSHLYLELVLTAKGPVEIMVLDDLGRVLLQQSEVGMYYEKIALDLSALPAAMYWVQVKSSRAALVKKVIVVK